MAGREIGCFEVRADEEAIARFRAAIDLGGGAGRNAVPATFPITWLTSPGPKAALLAALGGEGGLGGRLPVHLEQNIETFVPLAAGGRYAMRVFLDGPDEKGRARITAEVCGEDGGQAVRLSGVVVLMAAEDIAP